MRYRSVSASALLCLGLLAGPVRAEQVAAPTHRLVHVQLGDASSQPAAGRLLLFAMNARDAGDKPVENVDASAFEPTRTRVAAREVEHWQPGQLIDIDADRHAFPAGYSQLPPGDYLVQAVLDVDHNYNYSGRGQGDLVSPVVKMHLPGPVPTLVLDHALPGHGLWSFPPGVFSPMTERHMAQAKAHAQRIDFVSPSLSAFWGRPVHMSGWVLLPPGYQADKNQNYPVVYTTHGYGGGTGSEAAQAAVVYGQMAEKAIPPMIWVLLDESSPTGTHEFADSVNNGPWGHALTTELIPALEADYRMDARPSGRFLTGHSSGGWATLWLQTRYPKVFGGTWSTSPDPSDFHDFTGIDLYAPHANVYRRADGSAYPLVRDHDKLIGTFEQFARMERVLGPYGGQLASFEWVFSPRGKDGRPMPMFNRDTGAVYPTVVAYWRDHYDIAHRLQQQWPTLKRDLDGKIHVYVGTADTFYLDGAARRLKAVLDGLHANAEFRFLPGKTHFDLYAQGKDHQALLKQIAWAMYAQARPDSPLKPPATAAGK